MLECNFKVIKILQQHGGAVTYKLKSMLNLNNSSFPLKTSIRLEWNSNVSLMCMCSMCSLMFVKNGLHGGILKIKNTFYCNYTLFASSFSYYSDNNVLKVLIPYLHQRFSKYVAGPPTRNKGLGRCKSLLTNLLFCQNTYFAQQQLFQIEYKCSTY